MPRIGTMNRGEIQSAAAAQRRRTPKPGGSSGGRGQRASVLEFGGAPPLSSGEWALEFVRFME